MTTRFAVGARYGVLRLDDAVEVVTVASRTERSVTLTDGRRSRIFIGVTPNDGFGEVLRLPVEGWPHPTVAHVVRACSPVGVA